MAVYTRGYRPYGGKFGGAPAAWTIFTEGYRHARASKAFKFVGVLFLIWFVIWGAILYFTLGVEDLGIRRDLDLSENSSAAIQLQRFLVWFYGGVSVLGGLLAMLLGAGLVADDLRTRALSLYLVRPIRPIDYVLGKALILPGIFLWLALLPGLTYYLLVGLWRPPGQTTEFLSDNLDIVWMVVQHFFISSLSYAGLMLTLSARSERRGAVTALAAAILFGGLMLAGILGWFKGIGQVAKYVGLPLNCESGFALAAIDVTVTDSWLIEESYRRLPHPDVSIWVGVALFLLGCWITYRRASTVEVSA